MAALEKSRKSVRTLVIKLIALFLVTAGIAALIRQVSAPPPGWGEPRTALKWEEILETKPNTVFLGSSRVFNHFDPREIDPLLQQHGIRSYNLGLPASQFTWSKHQVHELLDRSEQLGLKYVLVEAATFDRISPNRMHDLRSRYWMTASDVTDAAFSTLRTMDAKTGARTLYCNGGAYLMKLYNIDFFSSQYHRTYKTEVFTSELLDWDPEGRGFYSPTPYRDGNLSKSYQALRDTPDLLSPARDAAQADAEAVSPEFPEVLAQCRELIESANAKNVRLIFMLVPRSKVVSGSRYLHNNLPEANRIDFDRADLFPDLYTVQYSFDAGHMNRAGVTIFSRHAAEIFGEYLRRHALP